MRPAMFLSCLLPGFAIADPCPPPPDHELERTALMAEVAIAPDEAAARALSNKLWQIWTDAPDDKAQALLDYGMSRRSNYDFEAAIASFSELIEYCPDYAEGYNQRAFIYFMQMDYSLALNDLERALELSPEHIGAKSGMALTLLHMGRFEVGQSVLRQALELNPWLPERGYLVETASGETQ